MTPPADQDLRIPDHERHDYKHGGAKDTAIHHQFGNITHYCVVLNRLLNRQGALAYASHRVNRLRGRRRAGR